jgi:biotin synthase
MSIAELLQKDNLSAEDITLMLQAREEESLLLFKKAAQVKEMVVKNKVYFRGLIEFSNSCSKNCLYCGIRKDNAKVKRYNLTDAEILEAARFAWENRYGSIVLQSGELESDGFSGRIEKLLDKIGLMSNGNLRVTLSCGEQTFETYRRWYEHGASRYLLRIESSNDELYRKLHPNDPYHSFEKRIQCLEYLKKAGYQVGTGVMIGLPFQTYEDLAGDILFMKQIDCDMVGMGPYLEHPDTPLYKFRNQLLSKTERFQLALKMIAVLRLVMRDVNIAAATALQAIDPMGREKALKVGANVIMPNITPGKYRNDYRLYENKPCTDEDADDCHTCLEARIAMTGHSIAYDEWGDSGHFIKRSLGDVS